ncbi:MAG TPA: 2-oxo acid dehydrogenase subunit E2 [Pseudomonas sp.]|nr:2-oxo acid dehydrogenase subunit E2 [Pseudomonas sp.]
MTEDRTLTLAPWPQVDFSAFGKVEEKKLSRIQQLTGSFLCRNWAMIPHVTHHDEADITEMEHRRKAWNAQGQMTKITPVSLLIKALVVGLKEFPIFNSSLSSDGSSLVTRQYFNVGVAVDTPQGLLVPVIRDCDKKSVSQIAAELSAISDKARSKGLSMAEMSGSCISLSSLGHIGGTGFTPIINAPDVAILGVTRSREVPTKVHGSNEIDWRLMLPLSLSYDHRVINGADAARFTRCVADFLASKSLFS